MPEDNAKVVNIHYTQRIEGLGAVYNMEALAEGTAEFYKNLVARGVPRQEAGIITAVMLKPVRESSSGEESS